MKTKPKRRTPKRPTKAQRENAHNLLAMRHWYYLTMARATELRLCGIKLTADMLEDIADGSLKV